VVCFTKSDRERHVCIDLERCSFTLKQ